MLASERFIKVPGPIRRRRTRWRRRFSATRGDEGAGLATLACLFFLISPRRRRTKLLLVFLVVGMIANITSCGGGGAASSRTTTTTLTSNIPNVGLGSSVTFSTVVTSSAGAPTGTVTLADDGTIIATQELTNGRASFADNSLALGPHSIVATYNGDGTHEPSASAAVSENVTLSAIISITATDALGNSVTSPLSVTID
jgi:hypothetical protein